MKYMQVLQMLSVFVAITVAWTVPGKAWADGTQGGNGSASTVLKAGTNLVVLLKHSLKSGEAKPGQTVQYEVAEALTQDGSVVVHAGTAAFGTVMQSRASGAFGRPGMLRISCDYIVMPSGQHIPLRTSAPTQANGRSNTGAAGATGTVVGATVGVAVYVGSDFSSNFLNSHPDRTGPVLTGILSGLASGILIGSFFRGGNVSLAAGHPVPVVVSQDTILTVVSAAVPVAPPAVSPAIHG